MSQALYRLQRQGKAWYLVPVAPAPQGHTRTTCPGPMRGNLQNNARVLVERGPDGNVVSVERAPEGWVPAAADTPRPLFRDGYFANPYNFVPFSTKLRELEGLQQEAPVSHATTAPDTYRAKLTLTLTTKTPLLTMEVKDKTLDHPTVLSVRRDLEGRPLLSGSSIKGMLRSVYEQVTGSRLGIFSHDEPLSVRGVHTDALGLSFAKVAHHDPSSGTISLTTQGDLVPTAIVPHVKIVSPVSVLRCMLHGRTQGASVYAWLQLLEHDFDNKHYLWWRVVSLHDATPNTAAPPVAPRTPSHKNAVVDAQPLVLVEGTLHVTGQTFGRKKAERMFVERVVSGAAKIDNATHPTETGDRYRRTVDAWRGKLASFNTEPPEGNGLETAGYVNNRTWARLEPGQTIYYRNGNDRLELYPAMITRESLSKAPAELLPALLAPSPGKGELSPAERLFGWVPPRGSSERAHRGQLRIGAVTCEDALPPTVDNRQWQLATLNSPKPSHARFYTRASNGAPTHTRKKREGFKAGDQLAGHKVYPHQQRHESYWKLPPTGWPIAGQDHQTDAESHFKNYLSAPGASPKVAVAITDWVEPDTTFSFTLYVENASRAELAALLWLIDLASDGKHFLKLGMGKPLGFGSVKLDIRWEHSNIQSSEQVRVAYGEFAAAPTLGQPQAAEWVKEFDAALRTAAGSVYRSVCAAAEGTPLAVHYPRMPQQGYGREAPPQAETYRWFVANEPNGVHNNQAKGHALPLLEGTEMLPVDPHVGRLL